MKDFISDEEKKAEEATIERVDKLIMPVLNEDATLNEIKANAAENFNRSREAYKALTTQQRLLSAYKRKMVTCYRHYADKLQRQYASVPVKERPTKEERDAKIRFAVNGDSDAIGCKGLVDVISKTEDNVQTLENVLKCNRIASDQLGNQLNAVININKNTKITGGND